MSSDTRPALVIADLHASVNGKGILHGIDLVVGAGEVHAVMGPNGSGKSTLSHVLMGKPGYEVTSGSVTIGDIELLGMPTWRRVQVGLFLAMQYPIEVPGVSVDDVLAQSFMAAGRSVDGLAERARVESDAIGFERALLERSLNVDLSGGEKKRSETMQLAVLEPQFAVLDELDSGLDVDALRACSRRIEQLTNETDLGVLAITHYSRLLTELKPDVVHVLANGRIQATGGPELADQLEDTGYAAYGGNVEEAAATSARLPGFVDASDPFADPFADPLR